MNAPNIEMRAAPALDQLLAAKRAEIAKAKKMGSAGNELAKMQEEADVLERFISYAEKLQAEGKI